MYVHADSSQGHVEPRRMKLQHRNGCFHSLKYSSILEE